MTPGYQKKASLSPGLYAIYKNEKNVKRTKIFDFVVFKYNLFISNRTTYIELNNNKIKITNCNRCINNVSQLQNNKVIKLPHNLLSIVKYMLFEIDHIFESRNEVAKPKSSVAGNT